MTRATETFKHDLTHLGGLRARARRWLILHRRSLATVLAGVSVLVGWRSLAAQELVTVEVAARDLASGHVIVGSDLKQVSYAPDAVPNHAARDLVGQELVLPVGDGELITEADLAHPELAERYPGTVAMPIRISDSDAAELLTAGDVIDLFAVSTDDASSSPIATDIAVLSVPKQSAQGFASGTQPGRLVVLAIPEEKILTLTETALRSYVMFSW